MRKWVSENAYNICAHSYCTLISAVLTGELQSSPSRVWVFVYRNFLCVFFCIVVVSLTDAGKLPDCVE